MGGYQLSYESFEEYVKDQARLAKAKREASEKYVVTNSRKSALYLGEAEGREDAVSEIAKCLGVSAGEVKRMWLEAEKE